MKNKINILIPMAGQGSRFAQAGYKDPKPFIDVLGKPMIERVLDNVSYPDARYIIIARKEHVANYDHIIQSLKSKYDLEVILIDKLTEGTACTVLYAYKLINNDTPLMIANSDQIVDMNIEDFINDCIQKNLDGSILCFQDSERNPKWSFAKVDEHNIVQEVKEKVAISDLATVGIYLFSKGSYFCENAIQMIIENDRVNNEFYTCPVYNYCIQNGNRITTYVIEQSAMHGTGTPEDLMKYIDKIK